jgi:hypothetical protein
MTKIDKIFALIITVCMAVMIVMAVINTRQWPDSIHNPVNAEYVLEVAFNLDIPVDSVTQEQFNNRYLNQ